MMGPFIGMVKRIANSANGDHAYGFVGCDDTQNLFGRDVFLNDTQANEAAVGTRVKFDVQLNARGMPQAHNMEVLQD